MKKLLSFVLSCCIACPLLSQGTSSEEARLSALYHSLDPKDVSKLLAFYELYPHTSLGQKALSGAWELITGSYPEKHELPQDPLLFPDFDVQAFISIVNKSDLSASKPLSKDQLELIEKLSSPLKNRKLKGFYAKKPEDILALDSADIDLARGLLLWQYEDETDALFQIRQYEALLDLMALQIQAKFPENASDADKIDKMNRFIFYDMQFRFPPHSLYAKDVDLYTFLPSVLDSRQGVCLGVSILYLCLAQRLGINLEIITPPGHIYVRLPLDNGKVINIETTARGIHMPTESYLSINTYDLFPRTMKEVIGMAFYNQASTLWDKDFEKTVKLYEKCYLFMPDDPLVKMLLGINYLQVGNIAKGRHLLEQIKGKSFPGQLYPESIPEDYLKGKTSIEGLKIIFEHVDETRDSILKKQEHLLTLLKKWPQFRAGLMHLAITYLQLGRGKEALDTLVKFHAIDPEDPTINYYLCVLSMQRFKYTKAWQHFGEVQKLLSSYHHMPKMLRSLKFELRQLAPSLGFNDCN